ncbi:hypothetical protein IKD57_04480 [Candidatus Saccharibacteria bacterium]|nr:hypothetical protein [Candidatus Saccharibacteria bacterium]
MKKVFVAIAVLALSMASANVFAIDTKKQNLIISKCDQIKEDLVTLQHNDARTRVYLGRYYETILNKFIVPLNLRLVENNTSNAGLIENQSNFSTVRGKFVEDFISYQKGLEELVAMDCKNEPGQFYEKLVTVRAKRATANKNVLKLRELAGKQVELVTTLTEKIK